MRQRLTNLFDRMFRGSRPREDGAAISQSLPPVSSDVKTMMAEAFFDALTAEGIRLEAVPYAVNIGCGDGRMFEDPVYPLYAKGFAGVAIDAFVHGELQANLGAFDVVLRPGTPVSSDNITAVLREAGCPSAPSFLKIDIDGIDADILRALLSSGIRPFVIQAEVNTEIPPPYAFSVRSSDLFIPGSEHGFYGFSLSYGCDLLATFGYKLYQLDFETPWTHDALWVHESLLDRIGGVGIVPRDAFMQRPAYLYHIEAASKETVTAWRDRPDHEVVQAEIRQTMIECSKLKLGHADVPFELYISR